MKFFLDSANLEEIKRASAFGIIDGVTTNPSLIAKEGVPVDDQVRRICDVIDGDISAAVIATAAKDMIAEGRRLSRIHRNVIVKVPLVPDGVVAATALAKEGVRTNLTLCFSAAQAIVAAKTGAYVVSPFMGRVDDMGCSGVDVLSDIVAIYKNYGFKTQVLAASIRGPLHVVQAAKAGAHIVTLSLKVLEQLILHPLTEKGLEQFLKEHREAFELTPA